MRIGDVAAAAGVSVSTLRAWEERYGVLEPERSAGGHRVYSEEDLARVRSVQQRVQSGMTVAAAAASVMEAPRRPVIGDDPVLLAALSSVRHRIIRAEHPVEIVEALARFATDLGGSVGPADAGRAGVLPVDIGLAESPPLLVSVDPVSVAGLRLQRSLPLVVEDARIAIERLRRLRRRQRAT